MPGGYFHLLCARRACAVAGITPVETEAMLLGSQGPDPLFLMGMFPLRPGSKPSRLAKDLHSRRTGRFLCALARGAKEGGAVERAFAMGFLTHYAIDSSVHPYVYSQSFDRKGNYSSLCHMALERGWDTMLWRRDQKRGTPFSMPGVEEAKGVWPRVARLMERAVCEAFPETPVTAQQIERGYADAARANRLTHSPRGVKYALYWLLERAALHPGLLTAQCCPPRLRKGDVFNLEGRPWHAAAEPEKVRTESVEALRDAGIQWAATLLTAAESYFEGDLSEQMFAQQVGDLGMDTGAKSRA